MTKIAKPQAGEFAPYAIMYIDLVSDTSGIIDQLVLNLQTTLALITSIKPEILSVPCAKGEWTIKEILIHIMDTERVFCYRALRFSRNDATELAGFEQDLYIENSEANDRNIVDLMDEYTAMRQATITLFKNLPEKALTRIGKANGNPTSVRAAAWFIAGHELHHINSIKENYL